MSRTLGRYLTREIFAASLLVLVAFLGLFAFFDFVNELDNVGKNNYQVHHALIYVSAIMPGRVYELFPVAVLIGSLYALTSLARHSEITVMRASGLSTLGILRVLGLLGCLPVALTFVFGEYIAPPAESWAQQWRLVATNSTVSQSLRSGLWIKDGARVVNVRVVQPDRTLEGVRVITYGDNASLASIAEVARGEYVSDGEGKGYWRLSGVVDVRFFDDHTALETPDELIWRSELSPEVLSVLMVVPERMSVSTLWTYIRHLHDNQQSADRYEIALWKKLIYPFANLVVLALALPFALTHERSGGASVKVFLGVMLGTGFHLLNGLFSNLGVINSWPPALAAFTPSLLFFIAAAVMLYWVERR
ncbi:LPS export ABC transporter permease LptG [Betaproteobacteria bacterium]|nr:LPS export ABC transporter permease LptG [Betaproteobacteria bacterium]GHT96182.1 LPS export ABC transporter permease LptG [Betaproteobacteria bacterium]GHT98244.1 LPS export ABC transporter permease LptG [Betaproteobacteria bacterium]GHU14130.1 LPS export ABC transporter permease LptG [Betaproteobacteria bacterium]GHU24669.1 LPS export ABC transporter permease LptG [Betaproteobacteria bacterium]